MASSQEAAPPPTAVKWDDFDKEDVFRDTKEYAAAPTCDNYVLEFGPNRARIVRDLRQDHFQSLLHEETRDAEYPIRWINIWDTGKCPDIVRLIGSKYAFSQRLISLMIYATQMQQHAAAQSSKKKNVATASKHVTAVQPGELERGVANGSVEMSPLASAPKSLPSLEGEEIELFLLLKDTVNYSSIDRTDRALCIGAHWLYRRPRKQDQPAETDEEDFMPPKHFLWLVLCDDHTVITFHESPKLEPMPAGKGWTDKDEWRRQQYKSMRANSLDVLLQQSEHGMTLYEQRPLSQSSIRQALKKATERSAFDKPDFSRVHSDMAPLGQSSGGSIGDEGTSNLFYYLFEDYSAAGPLKAASAILEKLTPLVLHSAERHSHVKSREIIKPLHMLSKDLRTLRHLFNNYMILISNIIVATKRSGSSAQDLRASLSFRSDANLLESLMSSDPERKVYLTTTALQRFDRLRDRLRGIMLNTIEGHFEEIKALQETYFNLTQQKDSSATARLTRSATLLAKLSVFFLPISFVTSYFSVQIEDLYAYWDARTYWYSFAVIATVSFLSLTFFGKLLIFFSDVMDDWAEYLRLLFWKIVGKTGWFKVKEEDEED